jgi:hypothetical protein
VLPSAGAREQRAWPWRARRRAWPARRAWPPRATGNGRAWGSAAAAVWDARQRLIVWGPARHACSMRGRRGVRSRRGVRGRRVRGRGGRAAGDQACQRWACQRRAWGSAAVRQQQCRSRRAAALTVGLHAFMLVLRTVKERGLWLSGCALGGEDVAGVSRMPAAMPRAGDQTHSCSTCWQQPRARAPQRSRREAASAPRLGTPPSRYDHDLGGMDTARQ